MFELRLKLILSAVSANDFAEAIVMCVCGLNVVDRKSSEVNKGTCQRSSRRCRNRHAEPS